jgi:hypothetical protein
MDEVAAERMKRFEHVSNHRSITLRLDIICIAVYFEL